MNFSYEMMRQCWESAPEDRPTFKNLSLTISKYIEHIAGYLEIWFNPFCSGLVGDVGRREDGEEEEGIEELEIGQSYLNEGDIIKLDIKSGTGTLTLMFLFILRPDTHFIKHLCTKDL